MGMQMERACTIAVYVHMYIICTWRHITVHMRYVHAIDMYGAATGMQIMRIKHSNVWGGAITAL